jgi:phage host-nuclease inhibitor protein Gam
MAKLPQYQRQLIERQATPGAAPVDTSMAQALGQAAQGLSQFAKAQDAMMQREAKVYTTEVKNQNTVAWAEYESELSRTAKSGNEYLEGVAKYIEAARQEALSKATSPKAAELSTIYFNDFEAVTQQNAIPIAAAMNAKRERNAFAESLDLAKTSVFLNPTTYDKQIEYLDVELSTTAIPESQKDEIRSRVKNDLNRSRVLGEIRNNPHEAVRKLYTGSEGLSSEDHEAMFIKASQALQAANASYLAEQKRINQEVVDMEKKVQEQTAMNGYELIGTDQLTFEWVTSNRSNLTQDDYKYFINKLERPDAKSSTNIQVYSDLYSQAAVRPVETKAMAHKALVNGELTIGDFNKVVTIAESSMKGELPSAYKRSTDYLRSVSRTNELNPPVGAGERFANAQNDFNVWFEQNQDATPQEAIAKTKEIWSDYALIDAPAILSSPKPYGIGKAKSEIKVEDLRESAIKLQKSYTDGVISEAEYKRQQEVLIKWKRSLEGNNG